MKPNATISHCVYEVGADIASMLQTQIDYYIKEIAVMND